MNRLYVAILAVLSFLLLSCQEKTNTMPEEVFEPKLVAICVQDIKASVNWYTQKLGFEVEQNIKEYPDYGLKLAFLRAGDFHLEILEKANSIKQSEFLTTRENYLGGVFKVGFILSDLEAKYNELKNMQEVEFLTGIGALPENKLSIKWPTHHFLIKDPDGNFIQFFELGTMDEISPWLFMITVDDLDVSVEWYTQNFGFKYLETVGEEGNRRAILERDGFVLELFEPAEVIMANQVSVDSTILGFKKLAFGIGDISRLESKLSTANAEIVMPVEKSDFTWASQSMIVKDPEGNWTQVFEIEK